MWVYCLFIFICSWVKAVVSFADVIFVWLAATFDHVQHSGDVITIHIRRHLLLRVLGMLHCREEDMPQLLQRLDWEKGFSKQLPAAQSVFPFHMIEEDNTVESCCAFVDSSGRLQRFVWDLDDELAAMTRIRSINGKLRDVTEAAFQPWATRSLDFVVDVQSDEVTQIVKANPWWEKLEFQLRLEQSKLTGFRSYLGDRPFNNKSRLVVWATTIPVAGLALVAWRHLNYVSSSPLILCDTYQLVPHCGFVLGVGIMANIIAALATTELAARLALNSVMYALEMQINKDWSLIMGSECMEDPGEFLQHPEWRDDVQSIPALWQIVSCEESVRSVALHAWDAFVGSSMRKPKMLASSALKTLF